MSKIYRKATKIRTEQAGTNNDLVRQRRRRDVIKKCRRSQEKKLTKRRPKSHKTHRQHLLTLRQFQTRHVHKHNLNKKLQQIQPNLHKIIRI